MMRKHFPKEEDTVKLYRTWAKEEQGTGGHVDFDEVWSMIDE